MGSTETMTTMMHNTESAPLIPLDDTHNNYNNISYHNNADGGGASVTAAASLCTSCQDDDDNDKEDLQEAAETCTTQAIWHLHAYQVASHQRHQLIFYLGILSTYFGVTACLLFANQFDDIPEIPFHLTEFWGAFFFSLAESMILTGGALNVDDDDDDDNVDESSSSLLLCADAATNSRQQDQQQQIVAALLGINVCTAAIAAVLYTMDHDEFEFLAHVIEYTSQITVTWVDFLFVSGGCPRQTVFVKLLLTMAVVKMGLYLGLFPFVSATEETNEHYSHNIEFVGEMLNCVWAYKFTWSLYNRLGRRQQYHAQRLRRSTIPETMV